MLSKARTHRGARELQTRGSGRKGHYLSTTGLTRLIQVESALEATAVFLADIDPRVQSLQPQPCSYELNSSTRFETRDELVAWAKSKGLKPSIYTPDFELTLTTGETLILEVRHTRFLAESGEKLFLAKRLLRSKGIRFALATENDITDDVRRNAPKLAHCLKRHVGDLSGRIDMLGDVTTGDMLLRAGFTEVEVLHLIATGVLRADLRRLLTKQSPLHRASDTAYLELLPL